MFDIIVIGAGVIGSLIARKLSSYKCNVLVLDKENDVGNGTSMANSAIVHSGYDPVPGTNKAKFNVLGNKMFPEMCEQLDVSLGKIGSLTIAVNDEQIATLKELAQSCSTSSFVYICSIVNKEFVEELKDERKDLCYSARKQVENMEKQYA